MNYSETAVRQVLTSWRANHPYDDTMLATVADLMLGHLESQQTPSTASQPTTARATTDYPSAAAVSTGATTPPSQPSPIQDVTPSGPAVLGSVCAHAWNMLRLMNSLYQERWQAGQMARWCPLCDALQLQDGTVALAAGSTFWTSPKPDSKPSVPAPAPVPSASNASSEGGQG